MLIGAEATLIRSALTRIAEQIVEERNDGYPQPFDIPVFDELGASHRLQLLELVATYLLTPTSEPLKLTSLNEATVGAVFAQVKLSVDMELLFEEPAGARSEWRAQVLSAYTYCFESESCEWDAADFVPTSVDSTDTDQWDNAIEDLANRILWDRDYLMAETFLDQPPEIAAAMKSLLGIEDDYFVDAGTDDSKSSSMDEVVARFQSIGL